MVFALLVLVGSSWFRLEEAQPDEEQDNEPKRGERAVLLEHQIPVDLDGGLAVLAAVVPQPRADLAHLVQAVPAVQEILDVLGHDLGHVPQLVVQLVQVLGGARVGVRGLGAVDEGVELHEGVRPEGGAVQLGGAVRVLELGADVREVGEGELPGVGALADAQVDDLVAEQVMQCERAGLDRGLRLGVLVQAPQDQLDLRLDLGERGLHGLLVHGGA